MSAASKTVDATVPLPQPPQHPPTTTTQAAASTAEYAVVWVSPSQTPADNTIIADTEKAGHRVLRVQSSEEAYRWCTTRDPASGNRPIDAAVPLRIVTSSFNTAPTGDLAKYAPAKVTEALVLALKDAKANCQVLIYCYGAYPHVEPFVRRHGIHVTTLWDVACNFAVGKYVTAEVLQRKWNETVPAESDRATAILAAMATGKQMIWSEIDGPTLVEHADPAAPSAAGAMSPPGAAGTGASSTHGSLIGAS